MFTQPIPGGVMAAMYLNFAIGFGLPVLLLLFGWRKLGAKLKSAFIGAGTFVLFALVLEGLLHQVVLGFTGTALTGNLFAYALYGGLAAAAFEETGRYLAMKKVMKDTLDEPNAWMYGIGHGGIECMLILGMTYLSNLIAISQIRNGTMEQALATVDAAAQAAAMQQLSAFWTTGALTFFMAGFERISAVALQMGLSWLMYRAVKNGSRKFFWKAFFIHFLVDASTVILASKLPIPALELVVAAMTAAVYFGIWKQRKAG